MLAAVGALPALLLFVFKPLTTLLVIAHAWPRGADAPRQRRLIGLGLVLSLVGDVALLWPRRGFLPGLVAFLLAHLAYVAAFCVPVRLAARPQAFALYGLVAAALGGLLFTVSDGLLATNKFAAPLPLAPLWILATYWLAQWSIASALRPPTSP